MLTVKLYTVRTRHGGVDCHCTLEYDERPVTRKDERIRFLSRTLDCVCGEAMHDGDRYCVDLKQEHGIVHSNCRELVTPSPA